MGNNPVNWVDPDGLRYDEGEPSEAYRRKIDYSKIKSLKYPVILKQALPYGGDGTIKLLQKQQMNIIKNTVINPAMKGIAVGNR